MGRKNVKNEYEVFENYIILKVQYKDTYVVSYIDKEDKNKVSQKSWRASHKKNKVYLCSGKSHDKEFPLIYLHNFLMNYSPIPGKEIDHIDGNSLNNRKNNLRLVTRQENIENSKARIDNEIGIRGVSRAKKSGLYSCDFQYRGKRIHLKSWKTCEEAVYARKVCEEIFGLEILKRNDLAKPYLEKLSLIQKQEIKKYVLSKTSGN